jgi:flagellar biosynthesis/type III secretory pathway protein FliH
MDDPQQERKAALEPAHDSVMQLAQELQRAAITHLLDAQRSAASGIGSARMHFAEQMRQGGHVEAQQARKGGLMKPWPRAPANGVFSGRMPGAVMIRP